MSPLCLDGCGYSNTDTNKAPILFDVIDASNITDSIGFLPILISVPPLLLPASHSVLYTGALTPNGNIDIKPFLHDHQTASILFGLSVSTQLIGFTTNNFLCSRAVQKTKKSGHPNFFESRGLLCWKFPFTCDQNALTSLTTNDGSLHLPSMKLSKSNFPPAVLSVCHYIKSQSNSSFTVSDFHPQFYTKELINRFLINLCNRIQVKDEILKQLQSSVFDDKEGNLLFQLLSSTNSIMRIVLLVPKSEFIKFDDNPYKLPFPILSLDVSTDSVVHISQCVHCSFVKKINPADPVDDLPVFRATHFSLQQSDRCDPDCYLAVSSLIPSTLYEEKNLSNIFVSVRVECGLDYTDQLELRFGSSHSLYQAPLSNTSVVSFISCYGSPDRQVECYDPRNALSISDMDNKPIDDIEQDTIRIRFNSDGRLVAFESRLQFRMRARTILRTGGKVWADLLGPCTLKLSIQDNCPPGILGLLPPVTCRVPFPYPIDADSAKVQVVRKYGRIVIVVSPLNESYPSQRFPVIRSHLGFIVPWSLDRVVLSSCPVLNPLKSSDWVYRLGWVQIGVAERKLLATDKSCCHPLTQLKASLGIILEGFCANGMFKGQQTSWFGISVKNQISILIHVNAVRLDLSNSSILLDLSVCPLADLNKPQITRKLHSEKIGLNTASDDEMQQWLNLLPAAIDRCKTWKHKESCEYKMNCNPSIRSITGCKCGMNKNIPKDFINKHSSVSNFFYRAAVSFMFPSSVKDFTEEKIK